MKTILIFLLVCTSVVNAEPITLDPYSPPTTQTLEREKMRLNFLQIKKEHIEKSHSVLMEADRLFNEELLGETQKIVARVSSWNEKLFAIKTILARIDELTSTQEEIYQSNILTLMAELYDIRVDSYELRIRINNVAQEVFLVTKFSPNYITVYDVTGFPENDGTFDKLNQYKADILNSLDSLKNAIDTDLEINMTEAVASTKKIVDELLLIRSVDYPHLADKILELREFTIVATYMEPLYKEIFNYKEIVLAALKAQKPFTALDNYNEMKARVQVLSDQIDRTTFSTDHKLTAKNRMNQDELEAGRLIDPDLFSVYVADRYEKLNKYIVPICSDVANDTRYQFNCGVLASIKGLDKSFVLSLEKAKLRFLEMQMNRVAKGVMGNE